MGQSPPIWDLCRGEKGRTEGSEEACLISWQPVSERLSGAGGRPLPLLQPSLTPPPPPQVILMNIMDGDGKGPGCAFKGSYLKSMASFVFVFSGHFLAASKHQ